MKIVLVINVEDCGLSFNKEKKSVNYRIFKEYFVCKFPRSYLDNSKTSNKLINTTGRLKLRGRCNFEKAILASYVQLHVRKDI